MVNQEPNQETLFLLGSWLRPEDFGFGHPLGVVDLKEGGVEGDVAEEDQGEGEDLQGARSLHFISLFKCFFSYFACVFACRILYCVCECESETGNLNLSPE